MERVLVLLDGLLVTRFAFHIQKTLYFLLVQKDDNEVVLKDAQDKVQHIPKTKIEQLVPQRKSLMPDLLVRDMTAQQVADLLAFLQALR